MTSSLLTLRNSCDLICLGIGNLNTELFLDSHDDLYGVERVKTEIGSERRGGGKLYRRSVSQIALPISEGNYFYAK